MRSVKASGQSHEEHGRACGANAGHAGEKTELLRSFKPWMYTDWSLFVSCSIGPLVVDLHLNKRPWFSHVSLVVAVLDTDLGDPKDGKMNRDDE